MDVNKQYELEGRMTAVRVASGTSELDDNRQVNQPTETKLKGRLARWNARVEGFAGLEARGIMRVLPEDKHRLRWTGYLQMFTLWFGMNLVAPNLIAGLLGPLVFNLGWVDCVCCVVFANALSSCAPAYISTFGPESGNRTMVRYTKLG